MVLAAPYFAYKNGRLCAESVPLADLAAKYGTPLYCYSQNRLIDNFKSYKTAFAEFDAMICYAVKANSNLAVLRALAKQGCGADVVSGGELRRALSAGIEAKKIAFAGVGKTRDEMRLALEAGIGQFNVESEFEIEQLAAVARDMGKTAPVVFRVNPDVDAQTHAKITTGKKENKFGIDYNEAPRLADKVKSLPSLRLLGLGIHIGSQLMQMSAFGEAFAQLRGLIEALRGKGFDISIADIGGGLGISYQSGETAPSPQDLAQMAKKYFADFGCKIVIAPGRSIAGNAGVLLTRVIGIKQTAGKRFVIVDAAMNDLLRPTLYEAFHGVIAEDERRQNGAHSPADLVGPVCETGDFLALDRAMPEFIAGDLLVLADAGAYGASMASEYNSRPLAAEVLIDNARHALIRKRPDFTVMTQLESSAPWL